MTRGILALLTFAATLSVAQPAPAAEPRLHVYEVMAARGVRTPGDVTLYLRAATDGGPGLFTFVQLAPRKGGGWTRSRFYVGMYSGVESRVHAYGGPAATAPVSCPVELDVCGKAAKPTEQFWRLTFRPAAGNRYLLAVSDGTEGYLANWGWGFRRSSTGARLVTADGGATNAAGAVTATTGNVEAFHSGTAPGGRYGSGAFAMMPCEGEHSVGTATLESDGSEPAVPITCKPGGYYGAFSGTSNGRTWSVTGPVVGETDFRYRLLVVDYPKR